MNMELRFLKFVNKTAACWLWTGGKHTYGYGMFEVKGDDGKWRAIVAHRVAWTLWRGPIPDGMSILHNCDVPACCNPDHLRVGTHKENMADRRDRKTHPFSKLTHCPQGHAYDEKNTYRHPTRGYKTCRMCANLAVQKTYWQRKAERAMNAIEV